MIQGLEGKEIVWVGPVPSDCRLCGSFLVVSFWDARTRNGRWALVCNECHREEKMGTGTGHGQLYEKQKDGRWLKVAG